MFSHIVRVKGFFDDEPKAKKLYFHLSRREMFDFIKRYDNVTNFQEWMQSAIDAEDLYTLMEFFDDLIGTSYGERQGEHFVKTPQIKESFLNSPEYEKLFDLFMENPGRGEDQGGRAQPPLIHIWGPWRNLGPPPL